MKFIKVKSRLKYPYYSVNMWSKGECTLTKNFQNKERAKQFFDSLIKKTNGENIVKLIKEISEYWISTEEEFIPENLEYFEDEPEKKKIGTYKQGYRDGKDAYEIGHPADPDDLEDDFTEEYIKGYWQGFNDAQEKEFYKQSAITQPNKPKPTTMLPDNMEWAWDPDAADWVAVLKDNTNTTPPLYNPNNQNVTNNTTTYMSNIKSATLEITDKNGKIVEEGMWLYKPTNHSTFRGDIPLKLFQVKVRHQKDGNNKLYLVSENKLVTKGINHVKDGILFDTYEEAKQYSESHKTKEEKEFDKLNDWEKTDHYLSKYSSCLAEFLDGPRYSKEVKIEAGLIKEGLLKYAGFDFNRGTKYTITTAGLEILRKASEAEHNEALNEREKLAYLFGFNTNKDTTLDTTGKEIKSDVTDLSFEEAMQLDITDPRAVEYLAKNFSVSNITASAILEMCGNMQDAYQEMSDIADEKGYGWDTNEDSDLPTMDQILKGRLNKTFTITEADGCELGKVTASSELDAKVKFGIEHPEYADSQSIKAIRASYNIYEDDSIYRDKSKKNSWGQYIPYFSKVDDSVLDMFANDGMALEHIEEALEYNYGLDIQTIRQKLKNNEISDDDIKRAVLYHWAADGARNIEEQKENFKDLLRYYKVQDKKIDAQYEQTTNTKEPYPNPSETPTTDVILENHDGWVNTANKK